VSRDIPDKINHVFTGEIPPMKRKFTKQVVFTPSKSKLIKQIKLNIQLLKLPNETQQYDFENMKEVKNDLRSIKLFNIQEK